MSAEVQKGPPTPQQPAECNRIVGLRFNSAVPFNGTETLHVEVKAGVTITPGRIDETGKAVPVQPNQPSQGLILERLAPIAMSQAKRRERVFVSWASGIIVQYGE